MSDFRHEFTPEARARGGQAAKGGDGGEGMSWLRRRNREVVLERIRSGDAEPRDRARALVYYNEDKKEGRFTGSAAEWCALHDVELPEPIKEAVIEQGIVSQGLLDVTVQIAGPEVAWGLMVIAGQIPAIPDARKPGVSIHY